MTVRSMSRKLVRIVVNELLLKASSESVREVLLTLKFNLAGAKGITSTSFNGVLTGIQSRFVNLWVLNNGSTWCGVGRRRESQENGSELWTRLKGKKYSVFIYQCWGTGGFHYGIKQWLTDFSLWFLTIAKEWFCLSEKTGFFLKQLSGPFCCNHLDWVHVFVWGGFVLVLCNKLKGFTPRGGRSFDGDCSFHGKPGRPVMCAGGRRDLKHLYTEVVL